MVKTTLTTADRKAIDASLDRGWMLEPDAKALLQRKGFFVPRGIVTETLETAGAFLAQTQGPVVIKAVSEKILHKTEFKAVVTGITNRRVLESQMKRLLKLDGCARVLVEEMVSGLEVFLGAKNDDQFGPVVILGLGGTAVEIYNDTAIRMAPVKAQELDGMLRSLKGEPLFRGYRGAAGVNLGELARVVAGFSELVMDLEPNLQSIDLNPVMCTADRCVVVDARIMLARPLS